MSGEKDNLSVVIYKKGDLRLEQTPIPKISDDEVLLKMHYCGICGTDLHLYEDGYLGPFVITEPLVIGHEISATVVETGKNVKHLKVGDRVCMEPSVPCGKCDKCRQGFYNHCPGSNLFARGLPPTDGCLRKFVAHPANWIYKLPDNVSLEEGALMEPLAVAVHAILRANATIGQNILVCGAGTMGLLCFLVAKAYGANKVYITDVMKSRLDLAKSLGADYTYQIDPKTTKHEDVVKDIQEKLGNSGADVAYECTGNEGSTRIGIYATRNGGKFLLVGLGPQEISVPLVNASLREVDIIGVCRFRNTFPTALHLLGSGKVNVKPLITHKIDYKNILDAFKVMKDPKANSLKVMLTL